MRDRLERYFCVLTLIYEVGVQMSTRLELPLNPFPSLGLSPPCSSFPGGDARASGGAISHVFAQPFAGDEHPDGFRSSSI